MTNIVPQTPALNQKPWEKLESYARFLVRRGWDLYSIAGPYGEQGRLKGKVTVPTNCWKIIVVMPRGAPVDSIHERTRIIAVDMPNSRGVANDKWEKYKTTVREIEQKTGLDFLSAVPPDLQEILENDAGR
jgi:endonuclease G